ncbi:hypothetical protein EDD85DRAFT_794500 [Armillaria nabsnona]|nr:hypothetical protein EDD85DRAFT_794500 [Armillaria nabsnona]
MRRDSNFGALDPKSRVYRLFLPPSSTLLSASLLAILVPAPGPVVCSTCAKMYTRHTGPRFSRIPTVLRGMHTGVAGDIRAPNIHAKDGDMIVFRMHREELRRNDLQSMLSIQADPSEPPIDSSVVIAHYCGSYCETLTPTSKEITDTKEQANIEPSDCETAVLQRHSPDAHMETGFSIVRILDISR